MASFVPGDRVRTYMAKMVLIFFGDHQVVGYGESTFLNIEAGGDGTIKHVGADGSVARAIDPDQTFTLTFTLLQVSPSMRVFQQSWDRDQYDGSGMEPVRVCDLTGNVVFEAAEAWVANNPARGYAADKTERTVVLNTGVGGYTEGEDNY